MGRRIVPIQIGIILALSLVLFGSSCEDIALRDALVARILGWRESVVLLAPELEGTVAERTPLLEWEASGGADHYLVKIAETEVLLADAEAVEAPENSYEMPGPVTIGDEYYWQVCAVSSEGESGAWSEIWHFSVIPSDSPVRIESSVIGTTEGAYNMKIHGNYAYVCANTAGLHIIDISDPEHPSIVHTETSVDASDIDFEDHYAILISESDSNFYVLNISDPRNPVPVSNSITMTQNGLGFMCLFMDRVYQTGSDLVMVVEISTISNPQKQSDITGIDGGGNELWDIEWDGMVRAVVTENLYGIHIVDNSGLLSSLAITGFGEYCQLDVKSGYAYVGAGNPGLKIVDISNPYAPSIVGTYETDGSCIISNISGDYCFTSDGNTMLILDISSPTSPVLIGSAEDIYCMEVKGNYGFSIDYFGKTFYVVDLLPVD